MGQRRRMRWIDAGLATALATLGCGGEADDPQAALVKRGKVVYESVCTSCHSRNPTQDGPLGPPLAGASLALLEAKVLRNEYPPGYVPKRDSKAMVPLPHVEPDLPAIEAYLAGFDGSS